MGWAREEITFEDDKQFLLIGHDLWQYEVDEVETKTTSEFIQRSKVIYEKYRTGEMSFKNFKHTEMGVESFLFLLEETFKIYEAAEANSKTLEDFHEIINRQFIGLRQAIIDSFSHEDLRKNIPQATLAAVNDILNNGSSEGTGSELQFVYLFIYSWEDILVKKEAESPVQSGSEYVARSIAALEEVEKKINAPSERSMETAVFSTKHLIEVLKASAQCAKDLPDFWNLANTYLVGINEAIEEGLVKDKSLKRIEEKVKAATEKALENIGQSHLQCSY